MNPRFPMPDDATIARMARVIHEDYLREDGYQLPDDHPANRPWDDLPADLQAQNLDQARDNIAKLGLLGIEVVPSGAPDATRLTLSSDEVTKLGQFEHDRWTDQKRAQGYEHGEVRCDEPPDLRHPDLVAWDELTEADQEKDKGPMRRLPDVLEAAGLMVRRHGAS